MDCLVVVDKSERYVRQIQRIEPGTQVLDGETQRLVTPDLVARYEAIEVLYWAMQRELGLIF